MKRLAPAMLLVLVAVGCNGNALLALTGAPPAHPPPTPGPTHPTSGPGPTPTAPPAPPAVTPPPASQTCALGRSYTAFGQSWGARVDAKAGIDRQRLKPYSALGDEFNRALGAVPDALASMEPTFGAYPNRWYGEPSASAITVFSTFRVSFQGCLALVAGNPQYATVPDATSAAANCSRWAASFWHRPILASEQDACVKAATIATAAEPDPSRRWAYTCAGLLSTASFLSF